MNNLTWLEGWYKLNCDDDWEHHYGIRIDTLDNPGWSFRVDLTGTHLEGKPYEATKVERGPSDWLHCSVKDNVFTAFGGPCNLSSMVETFRRWAEGLRPVLKGATDPE